MKQLNIPGGIAALGLARSLLESAHIPFEVRNEFVSQAMVGIPFETELWVNDEQELFPNEENEKNLAAIRKRLAGSQGSSPSSK